MSLQVWLPLNGDLHNQGLSKINVTNNGATINDNGKIGKCYSFNGIDNYLVFNNLTCSNWATFSLTCWCYPSSDFNYLFLIRGGGAHRVRVSGDGFMFRDSNNSTQRIVGFGTTVPLNTWSHIACIYNRGEIFMYINGILTNHSTTYYHNNSIFLSDHNEVRLARQQSSSGNSYYNGKINDFRIYDHALSAKEVKEIAKGLVLHYQLNNNGVGNENLLLNSLIPTSGNGATGVVKSIENGIQKIVASNPNSNWITFANHNTTLNLSKGDTFTFSLMIKSPDSNKKPTVYFQSGMGYFSMQGTMSSNWSIIYYTGTWDIDNLTTNIHLGFSSAPGTYYIKYFKLEKGNQVTPWAPNINDNISSIHNKNIIQDISGYNNNGIVTGNTIINILNNRYSISMKQANGQYIRVSKKPAECMPKDAITVNIWQYATTWSNPISCTEGGGWNFENSSGIRFPVYISGVGYKVAQSTITPASTLNAWHMLTGTMDKDNVKIYYDGEEVGTIAKGSTNGIGYANNYIFVGGEAGGNTTTPAQSSYVGSISDVRIYATALSAEDILELYKTSKVVSGTTVTARDLE